MTVLTSSKRARGSSRRRRFSGSPESPAAVVPPPAPARRRELGPQVDQALYTCSCGFVFHAAVSTSVGCPHCGGTQAW